MIVKCVMKYSVSLPLSCLLLTVAPGSTSPSGQLSHAITGEILIAVEDSLLIDVPSSGYFLSAALTSHAKSFVCQQMLLAKRFETVQLILNLFFFLLNIF